MPSSFAFMAALASEEVSGFRWSTPYSRRERWAAHQLGILSRPEKQLCGAVRSQRAASRKKAPLPCTWGLVQQCPGVQ
eukprot:scaffold405_cov243-Pinguiococcus_pyrenoidosus.AAC.2